MGERPMRVIMVCLGNICRSPMAEAVVRAKAAEAGVAVEVDSVGTGSWHVGDDADPRTRAVLAESDYPLHHRARTFDESWFIDRDLVLAMDHDNLAELRRLAPTPEDRAKVRLLRSYDPALAQLPEAMVDLAVPDPYYGDLDDFREVLTMVEAAADGLLASLVAHLKAR